MIDLSKSYKTRDGKAVRLYAADGRDKPIHGAIWLKTTAKALVEKEGWVMVSWSTEGKFDFGISRYDLVEEK